MGIDELKETKGGRVGSNNSVFKIEVLGIDIHAILLNIQTIHFARLKTPELTTVSKKKSVFCECSNISHNPFAYFSYSKSAICMDS